MENTPIEVEKITRNVFVAKTIMSERGREMTIKMTGHTEDVARQKLQLCLDGKPYKHLDVK